MKFADKYELSDAVTAGRLETFIGRDVNSGERVLVHIFDAPVKKPDQPTVLWVMESFRALAPEPPGLVIATGRYGTTSYAYVVTQVPDDAALLKWTQAYELHKRALRTRSTIGWHELRIGIKHLRYTVENFLPRQHAEWGDDLKALQDLLGEVHDLDVLWATAIDSNVPAFPDVQSRRKWRENLNVERNKRLARYREKMVGRRSLWRVWREELPSGPQLHAAAMSRLRTWAGYLDPEFSHAQSVAQLSLLLYDGLEHAGLFEDHALSFAAAVPKLNPPTSNSSLQNTGEQNAELDPRAVLQAAAFMHDVGRAINPRLCAEQMEGGVHMGLGYALTENFPTTNGVPDSLLLRDHGILRAKDMPKVDIILIEVPDEVGGYGAKGVGEIGCVATAGAVASALYSYDKIRRFSLPMETAPAAAPSLPKSRRKAVAAD